MKNGYYWLKPKTSKTWTIEDNAERIIGYLENYEDSSGHSWSIIGSDEIFYDEDFIIGEKIKQK